ncbi:MAG: DUF460 domain-containing protein [Acidilobaceae archaeon]|nr:DUF460 domain-containing protein [Acidilobaceae archaeon]MCX8166163.1 DUF460 domain-containing protein [Acidilobaceae archaeon]MDW7974801.1 DUF460 domain-containing protein [Sulfolobales archaeon]
MSSEKCMGVDLESGAPGQRGARFSLVVVNGEGKIVYKVEGASLAKLIRVAWEHLPAKVGFDNVYELAEDERGLVRALSLFPPTSVVVQVTLLEGQFLDVREVARRAGILEEGSKLSPSKTAYVCALLACKGYGTVVRSVEEKTVVQVSKLRSPSPGGWSQQRYQRRVRALIQGVANSIREALDKAGVDYDYFYRESKGGLESATFTVYAPREVVEGIVREERGQDYVVRVRPVYRSRLFLTPRRPERALIVGVDAGTTTGLAILDIEGNLLYASSSKGLDRGTIIDLVLSHGKPIMVATDVAEAPETVRKLAAQLGANLFVPPSDLSVAEKKELVDRFLGEPAEDTHQRDALAAALKAYASVRSKLEQIERKLEDLSFEISREEVKRWVIEGLTVAEALERAIERALEERREVRRVVSPPPRSADISSYALEVERLRAQKEALERRVRELEAALEQQERKLREAWRAARAELLRDAEIAKMEQRLRELERALEGARAENLRAAERSRQLVELLLSLARGDLVPARRLPSLTVSNVRRSERQLGKVRAGEAIVVEDPGTFEREAIALVREASAVLLSHLDSPLANALRSSRVPVLEKGKYLKAVLEETELALLSPSALEDAAAERERMERKSSLDLERIVEEYRSRRKY